MQPIDRREFLKSAAGVPALTGYTLWVRADPPVGESAPTPPRPPRHAHGAEDRPAPPGPEPNMALVELECDVLVAGGGMAGVCAALAAARSGTKVALIQDRSRLGGNASSEIRMHICGADCHGSRPGWREGGILEELRLDDAVHNPHRAYELWDLLLYDKCVSEPGITLLLDTSVCQVLKLDGRIGRVLARCDKTETMYSIGAHVYCDCTGDSRLALEAGAELRRGRESRAETSEPLALEQPDARSQGSSILFTAQQHDRPMPFAAPAWARTITREHLRLRPVGSWEYGYWWIELGGTYDTIADNERLRFELLSIVLGVWDYIKNSGDHPSSANWALQTVGMIPGKRESRRILGDHIMTQMDLEGGWREYADGIAIGGWNLDDHPPEGFDASDKPPFISIRLPEAYNIPLGSLYSRNVPNLMMAGRNISSTHVAFTSARVMGTCSAIGQAVGTVAAYCARLGLTPRQVRQSPDHLRRVRQALLRDDQSIRELAGEDDSDVARAATVRASSVWADGAPEHVIDGVTRDAPGSLQHRWASAESDRSPWIELTWDRPRRIGYVQITFDTGFHRQLTLSPSDHVTRSVIRGPQPETVRDYTLSARTADGRTVTLAEVSANHQRLRRHEFAPVEATSLRLSIAATNGADQARVYEIRCYESRPRLA